MTTRQDIETLRGDLEHAHKFDNSEAGVDVEVLSRILATLERLSTLESENARLEARVKRLVGLLGDCRDIATGYRGMCYVEGDRGGVAYADQTTQSIDAVLKEPQP